jgi:hypothetical protein
MPSGPGERYDFFLSRRGSVAAIAREVADVLTEKGYKVLVQDYDIPLGASFVEEMHEAIINSRDLIILFTEDYLRSPYTRKEFTSFEAERVKTAEDRHIIVLRCEDVPLRGLLADNVYQTLVGIEDPDERKRRIIAAAERQSQAAPPPPRPFIGVPPRIASFTGRADALDRLDAILMQDKPVAPTRSRGCGIARSCRQLWQAVVCRARCEALLRDARLPRSVHSTVVRGRRQPGAAAGASPNGDGRSTRTLPEREDCVACCARVRSGLQTARLERCRRDRAWP